MICLSQLFIQVVVKCHVCVMKKRPDPSLGGVLRWSIPYEEICYCQGVVAPRIIWQETCSRRDDCSDTNLCNLWFVDNPALLTQRQNWNKNALDQLLKRADYCGKFTTQLQSKTSNQLQIFKKMDRTNSLYFVDLLDTLS